MTQGLNLRRLASTNLRNILSYLPVLHLIPRPNRPNGISLIIRNRNEEWIDLSLISVKDFADEIVIADASTDDTPQRIEKLAREYNLNVKIIRIEDKSNSPLSDGRIYTYQSNLALKNTTYSWIFKWDADFIARTSGPYDIKKLREKLLSLDPRKYYLIYLSFVNLHCDLFHTYPGGVGPSKEAHIFTYSRGLVFKDTGRFERLLIPKYYKPLWIKEIYVFHLGTVKSAKRILYRKYWTDWRECGDYNRFPTLIDYIKFRLKTDYNIDDLSEGEKIVVKEVCKNAIPYDVQKYGDYPDVLKKELANPKYLLIYDKKGKLIGRNDIL
jgi:glycosyltransferase involved in cell wall biosynthesis